MKKTINLFLMLIIFSASLQAQVSSAEIEKSVVRVEVTAPGEKFANVCTGIIWKSPDQIVTSLHAMRLGGKIWVKYLGQFPREAEVVRVLRKADLVMLRLIPPATAPAGVVPFTSYHPQKPAEHSVIISLGYNRGAPNPSTQEMKKGYTKTETLASFIPKKDFDAIDAAGMPSTSLEIIYCNGSLQPGYSGAPAYDIQGRLLGIGDGGLEEGANNVSWIIPAKFLAELENSPVKKLPDDLHEIAQHFSARVMLEVATPEQVTQTENIYYEEEYEEYVPLFYEDYDVISSEDFEFGLTKTRKLLDMAETSDDPERLMAITHFTESNNVMLDYDYLSFDIYEDTYYGVLLAVPEGEDFYYDENTGFFQVDYSHTANVDLFYLGWAEDNSESDFEELVDAVMLEVPPLIQDQWAVEGFTVIDDFSELRTIDEDRKLANILLVSEEFEDAEFGGLSTVYLYMTVLVSWDKSFISVASFCMSNAQLDNANENGVDCIDNYVQEHCDYFEDMVKVFSAVQLTNFAY